MTSSEIKRVAPFHGIIFSEVSQNLTIWWTLYLMLINMTRIQFSLKFQMDTKTLTIAMVRGNFSLNLVLERTREINEALSVSS